MKLFAAAIAVTTLAAAAATPPPPGAEPVHDVAPDRGLRQALEDYLHLGTASPPPRHLSRSERAELRRQLDEYDRTLPRPNVQPDPR